MIGVVQAMAFSWPCASEANLGGVGRENIIYLFHWILQCMVEIKVWFSDMQAGSSATRTEWPFLRGWKNAAFVELHLHLIGIK